MQEHRLDYIDKLRGFAILCKWLVGHILIIYTQEKTRYPLVGNNLFLSYAIILFLLGGYVFHTSPSLLG